MSRPADPVLLPSLKRELVAWCQKLWDRGWVANHDGNVSCRLGAGKLLCTPTAFSKAAVREDDLLVCDLTGKKLQGRWNTFGELKLHLAAYKARPDAVAVLHAHPPTATGFSIAGIPVETTAIAEAVVSLGPKVPTLPFAMPGSEPALDALGSALAWYDAVILANHGVLTVGKDLEQAYLRMELVEHLARMQLVARQLGATQMSALTDGQLQELLKSRTKAGLGPESRGLTGAPPL